MRQKGSAGPGSGLPQPASEPGLGLEELARTLDRATRNLGVLSLDAAWDAANANSALAGADSAYELAGRLTRQMTDLEAAISEVVRGTRR